MKILCFFTAFMAYLIFSPILLAQVTPFNLGGTGTSAQQPVGQLWYANTSGNLTSSGNLRVDPNNGRLVYGTGGQFYSVGSLTQPSIGIFGTNSGGTGIGMVGLGTVAPIIVGRSASTILSTYSAVSSGQDLFHLDAVGDDGVDYKTVGARISATVDGAVLENIIPSRLVFSTANTSGTVTEWLRISSSGYVGIGTTTPQSTLQVAGDVGVGKIQGGSSAGMKVAYDDGTGGAGTTTFRHARWGGDFYFTRSDASGTDRTQLHFGGSGNHYLDVYDNNNNVTVHINSSGDTYFNGGNVGIGIGTASPDAKLAVKGQIHAQEVKVDLNGAVAPDYVFNKDYKLPSLAEIKTYIDENKHLPEIPSAKEMEKNGIQLGEMNMMLLKKIEELTLYMIEQNKKIDTMQIEINQLKK